MTSSPKPGAESKCGSPSVRRYLQHVDKTIAEARAFNDRMRAKYGAASPAEEGVALEDVVQDVPPRPAVIFEGLNPFNPERG